MLSHPYTIVLSALSFTVLVAAQSSSSASGSSSVSSGIPSITVTFAPIPIATSVDQCLGGAFAECCDIVESAEATVVTEILQGLGITLPDLSVNVGMGCTAIMPGDFLCPAQTVCCSQAMAPQGIAFGCGSIHV